MIRPQPGPQTLFAACSADIGIFASTPGSGKSYALCSELLRWHKLPRYTGVGFRAHARELNRGPTSLFGTLREMSGPLKGRAVQSPRPGVRFPSGAEVLLDHAASSKSDFDGLEIAVSCFDELQSFEWPFVDYLVNSRGRSTCGLVPYMRASCMPTNDIWLTEWAKPWLTSEGFAKFEESGKVRWMYVSEKGLPVWFESERDALEATRAVNPDLLPTSVAFIFAQTKDNLALMAADPTYVGKLAKLTGVERMRLGEGCWFARAQSAGMFDRTWFEVVDAAPNPRDIVASARGWDRAATKPSEENEDPDWTRGVRWDLTRQGRLCLSDVVSTRDRPGPVLELIEQTARLDGPMVTQAFSRDPGSSGVTEEEQLRAALSKVVGCGPLDIKPTTRSKVELASGLSAHLERAKGTPNRGQIVRAVWTSEVLSELEKFPTPKVHDDIVDACSQAWRVLSPRVTGAGDDEAARAMLASLGLT